MCVSVHPVLWRERHFVQVAAVPAAFTGKDEHDQSLETLAIRADEGYRRRACAPWQTAPSVCAAATVVGPVQAGALAFTVGQVDGFWGAMRLGTLLPSLKVKKTVSVFLLINDEKSFLSFASHHKKPTWVHTSF